MTAICTEGCTWRAADCLGSVASGRIVHLRVDGDARGLGAVRGAVIDVDVADAVSVAQHGDARVLFYVL